MSRPREPVGGASEASRLLQEGLALLAERTREADAAVQHAQERSQRLIADAEDRARAISAAAEEAATAAERSRADVEQQLTTLRAEIAEARKELGQLKAAHAESGRGGRGAAAAAAAAPGSTVTPASASTKTAASAIDAAGPASVASAGTDAARTTPGASTAGEGDIQPAGDAAESARTGVPPPPLVIDTTGPEAFEPASPPRWGRPSSIPAVQASRVRSSRPRWLPPWLPFVIILLASVGIVTATVGGQAGAGGQTPDSTDGGTIVVSVPTGASPTPTRAGLAIAAATTLATSVVVAASSIPQVSPSGLLATTPSPGVGATLLPAASRQPTTPAGPSPTARATPPPTQIPPPQQAQFIAPIPPPGPVVPDPAIVGAYTAYTTYVVREGDTLNRVAAQFGVSRDIIVNASHLADPNLLQPGQVLAIPRDSGWLYRVQPGDTLEQLAQRYGVSVDALVSANALPGTDIHPGDLLLIPTLAAPAPKQ